PYVQIRGLFTAADVNSESGLVEGGAVRRRSSSRCFKVSKDWPYHQAKDDPHIGCCAIQLTKSLRNSANCRLTGRRMFPHLGGEEFTGIRVNTSSSFVNFICRNQLTSISAYHLLHLLHHLN